MTVNILSLLKNHLDQDNMFTVIDCISVSLTIKSSNFSRFNKASGWGSMSCHFLQYLMTKRLLGADWKKFLCVPPERIISNNNLFSISFSLYSKISASTINISLNFIISHRFRRLTFKIFMTAVGKEENLSSLCGHLNKSVFRNFLGKAQLSMYLI